MKKISVILAAVLLLASSQAFAMRMEMVGGIRNGLAIGLLGEEWVNNDFALRLGAEADTGNEGLIFLLGGKFYLTNLGDRTPLYLGLGMVGYVGTTGSLGLQASAIFDRLFGVRPLFMEAGADFVANSIRLQLQLGYKF